MTRTGIGRSPVEAIATARLAQDAENHNNKLEDGDNFSTPTQEKQSNSHNRYKQSPTIKVIIHTTIATNKNIQNTPTASKKKNVIDNYDLKPNNQAHIKDAQNSNRPDTPHTKPTTQPTNTVGIEPTVAAGRKPAITPSRTDNTTPLPPRKTIQKEHNNNNYNTPQLDHTITSKTLHTNTKKRLSMSTPEQPST